jgi:hypothetical protein
MIQEAIHSELLPLNPNKRNPMSQKDRKYVDFKVVKDCVSITQILERYDLLKDLRQVNDDNNSHSSSTIQEAPEPSPDDEEPVNEATATVNQAPVNKRIPIPSEPGKGGEQHRAIQQRLKTEAETLGFGVSIEKNIPDTHESIDVVIEQGDLIVACEICVSTSIDHELGNIRKCLRAGYTDICAICLDAKRMKQFKAATDQCLTEQEQAQLHCIQPDAFQAKLKELLLREQLPITGSESDRVLGKYQVTSKYAKLDEAERLRKEEILRQVIADALKSQ